MANPASGRGVSLAVIVFALGLVAQAAFCQQAPTAPQKQLQTQSRQKPQSQPQPQTPPKGPLIILTAFNAPEGDPLAAKLASTITSSVALVMRLAGGVIVQRADFLTPSLSLRRAELYYKQEGADGAVFGSVTPASGGTYVAKIDIWNSSKSPEKPASFERTIQNPLEIFDISDQLSLEAGSTVVGRELTSGTLVIKNTAILPHYSVYADGELLGRDRSSFQILTGPRKIVVAKPGGPLGDVPVEEFSVDIHNHQTTDVTLTEKPKVVEQPKAAAPAAKPAAAAPVPAGRSLLPTFSDLNSQFTQLRSRDWPYALAYWGSYGLIFAGVAVGSTGSSSSSTLTPEGALGLGIAALGLTGTIVTSLIDPHRLKLRDARQKISGLPVMTTNRSLEELQNEIKAYRKADVPYTLTYWGSFAAIIAGIVIASSAPTTTPTTPIPTTTTTTTTSSSFNVQQAAGFALMYAGIGGMIGTSNSDPYRAGIRQLRRDIRAAR